MFPSGPRDEKMDTSISVKSLPRDPGKERGQRKLSKTLLPQKYFFFHMTPFIQTHLFLKVAQTLLICVINEVSTASSQRRRGQHWPALHESP